MDIVEMAKFQIKEYGNVGQETAKALIAENARLHQEAEITNDTMRRMVEDQQSPALAVPENKKLDYWHMKYDELLTKTVTIFDENIVGFLEWYEKSYDAAGGLSADLVAKAWVDSRHLMAPSPRITEQDAREIIQSLHTRPLLEDTMSQWLKNGGRELLNKLNGDKNGQ